MIMFVSAGLTTLRRSGFPFLFPLLLALLSGCAGPLEKAGRQYYAGQPESALEILSEDKGHGGRNQLLYRMERGVISHELGRYRESVKELLAASKLIEEFETISASEQVASLATTEWLVKYKGEYSERLWVHSYLMMNFLLLGDYDSAQVEARRALQLFQRYPDTLNGDYFTRALMALCFDVVGEENDAYLVYRKMAKDMGDPGSVAPDLVRLARRLGQQDEVERYRPHLPEPVPQGAGELVLFVASGRIPKKQPGNVVLPPSIRFSFPYYRTTSSPPLKVGLLPSSVSLPVQTSDLAELVDRSLKARKVRIITKETARVTGKEAISREIGKQFGDAAEVVTRLSLFILEEPDVRSWQTLPGRLTMLRVPLPAGHHDLRVKVDEGFRRRGGEVALPPFDLRPGQRVFRAIRY